MGLPGARRGGQPLGGWGGLGRPGAGPRAGPSGRRLGHAQRVWPATPSRPRRPRRPGHGGAAPGAPLPAGLLRARLRAGPGVRGLVRRLPRGRDVRARRLSALRPELRGPRVRPRSSLWAVLWDVLGGGGLRRGAVPAVRVPLRLAGLWTRPALRAVLRRVRRGRDLRLRSLSLRAAVRRSSVWTGSQLRRQLRSLLLAGAVRRGRLRLPVGLFPAGVRPGPDLRRGLWDLPGGGLLSRGRLRRAHRGDRSGAHRGRVLRDGQRRRRRVGRRDPPRTPWRSPRSRWGAARSPTGSGRRCWAAPGRNPGTRSTSRTAGSPGGRPRSSATRSPRLWGASLATNSLAARGSAPGTPSARRSTPAVLLARAIASRARPSGSSRLVRAVATGSIPGGATTRRVRSPSWTRTGAVAARGGLCPCARDREAIPNRACATWPATRPSGSKTNPAPTTPGTALRRSRGGTCRRRASG